MSCSNSWASHSHRRRATQSHLELTTGSRSSPSSSGVACKRGSAVRAALCGISQVPLCSAMSKAGVSQVAGAAVDTMAEAAPQAEAAPARISAKGKRGTAVDDSATPAKRARKVAADSGSKKDARQKKEVPQEPVKPELPKNAFTLFGKVKWPVLVGTPQDRLEQAQLMWKVLPPNDRSAYKVEARARCPAVPLHGTGVVIKCLLLCYRHSVSRSDSPCPPLHCPTGRLKLL